MREIFSVFFIEVTILQLLPNCIRDIFTHLQNICYCITSSLMFLIRISARAINDTVVTLFMRDLRLLQRRCLFQSAGSEIPTKKRSALVLQNGRNYFSSVTVCYSRKLLSSYLLCFCIIS